MTTNDLASLQAAMAGALPDELSTAQALLTTLLQEQDCLSAGDAEQLAVLLEIKAVQVAMLARLAAQRHQRLASGGFAASETGMQDWLASDGGPVQAPWETLLATVRQAHEVNRVNGLLLAQQCVRNRQYLHAMGMTGGGQHPAQVFYGPDGQMGHGTVKRASVQG